MKNEGVCVEEKKTLWTARSGKVVVKWDLRSGLVVKSLLEIRARFDTSTSHLLFVTLDSVPQNVFGQQNGRCKFGSKQHPATAGRTGPTSGSHVQCLDGCRGIGDPAAA